MEVVTVWLGAFVLGTLGGLFGVLLWALLAAAKQSDEQRDRWR